jgi:hypothetical protein
MALGEQSPDCFGLLMVELKNAKKMALLLLSNSE